MSRLDSHIRRVTAQRDCLDALGRGEYAIPAGLFLEIGFGSGRTWSHLSQKWPDRRVLVCDRAFDLVGFERVPAPADRIEGDVTATLPALRERMGEGAFAVIHCDLGTADRAALEALMATLTPSFAALLADGGILVTSTPVEHTALAALVPPAAVPMGRYFMARRLPRP